MITRESLPSRRTACKKWGIRCHDVGGAWIMGITIYSPPLDELGNPVRGIAFSKELIKEYSLHQFDHIAEHVNDKNDPRMTDLKKD